MASNAAGVPVVDQQHDGGKNLFEGQVSSFVEERSRIFHEDIPIPGTGMSLHYTSNRVPGYQHFISVPASGPTVPESLKQIIVKLEIAGRTFAAVLDPLPDQNAEFVWNGRDHLGSAVAGSITAQVNIGFVYPAVYMNPGGFVQAFAQAGGSVTGIRSRQEVISWKRNDLVILRSIGASGTIGEGWTLSRHHQMSLSDPNTIHRGDGFPGALQCADPEHRGRHGNAGIQRRQRARNASHTKLALPRNRPPVGGHLFRRRTVTRRIRKIDREGIITTVAGGGSPCRGDGAPAVEAYLQEPQKAVFDASGNMYISDAGAGNIRKVDLKGIITTAAAGLSWPDSVAVDSSGNLYVTEQYANRVHKIDPGGTRTTLVSGGFSNITDLALDSAGNLYITDRYGCRVVKMDTNGRMTTVAGTGSCGYSGDGGPATQARLSNLYQVAVDLAGNLYIADDGNGRVRKVDSRGIIATVAGNGTPAPGLDGKPATQTSLYYPFGIAVALDGSLYVIGAGRASYPEDLATGRLDRFGL